MSVFEYGWREDHAKAGDIALGMAEKYVNRDETAMPVERAMALGVVGQVWAAIAQAHYAAANIRTRPIRDAELPVTDVDWMTRERAG